MFAPWITWGYEARYVRLLTPDQFSPFAPMAADRRNTTAVIRMLKELLFEGGGDQL